MSETRSARGEDAYIAYIRRFFGKWLPVYDLFALSVAWVYRAAAARAVSSEGLLVLDVCTGTGELALRCARRGARVTGIDITEPMLERARAKGGALPVEFRLMDARRLEFPDASFDVVTLSLALHDMPAKVRRLVLREVARVARDRLIIVDYELGGPTVVRRWLSRSIQLFETAYFKRFVDEGLPALLADCGLERYEVSRIGFPFFGIYCVRV
jgi:ubiquinone/menaquinone biosynthesis C-methylase UbiE